MYICVHVYCIHYTMIHGVKNKMRVCLFLFVFLRFGTFLVSVNKFENVIVSWNTHFLLKGRST